MLPKRITFLDKVLEEQTFDVQTDLSTAIERLCETEDWDCETDTLGNPLQFGCNKKGKFVVYSAPRQQRSTSARLVDDRIYYLTGKVTAENGKTCVKVRTLKNRAAPFVHLLSLLPITMCLAILADTFLKAKAWPIVFVVALVLLAVYVWDILAHVTRERNNKELDLKIMREEITRRIDAIDK